MMQIIWYFYRSYIMNAQWMYCNVKNLNTWDKKQQVHVTHNKVFQQMYTVYVSFPKV